MCHRGGRRYPGAVVAGRRWSGTGVTGGGCDVDASGRGVQEPRLDDVVIRVGTAGDRIVECMNTIRQICRIDNDLVDRSEQRRTGATVDADVVGNDVCVRQYARDVARQRRRGCGECSSGDDVTCGGTGGVAAVAIGVLRRRAVRGTGKVPGADQLVVAELRIDHVAITARHVVARAERIRVIVAVATDVGERGVVRVNAGVQDRNDDPFAHRMRQVIWRSAQDVRRVDPLRTDVGQRYFVAFTHDRFDAGHAAQCIGLCFRHFGRERVENDLVIVGNVDAAPNRFLGISQEFLLLLLQMSSVLLAGLAVRVELVRARGTIRCRRKTLDAAHVGGDRVVL